MFYVYIIKSQKDKSLYIGSTNDLKRRFEEHNNGKSNYTRSKRPFELIYYEAFKSKTDAISRERNLKKFNKTYSELKKRISNSLQNWWGEESPNTVPHLECSCLCKKYKTSTTIF